MTILSFLLLVHIINRSFKRNKWASHRTKSLSTLSRPTLD